MGLLKKTGIVSYPVRNWAAARKFYEEKLELPIAWFGGDETGWIEYGDKEGLRLALTLAREGDGIAVGNNGVAAFYYVENLEQAVAELKKRGVRCDLVPDMVDYAVVYDPEGNRLQLLGM